MRPVASAAEQPQQRPQRARELQLGLRPRAALLVRLEAEVVTRPGQQRRPANRVMGGRLVDQLAKGALSNRPLKDLQRRLKGVNGLSVNVNLANGHSAPLEPASIDLSVLPLPSFHAS